MKIKKGDKVQVMKGKDRGKTGIVSRVDVAIGRVAIEGINLGTKHLRPKKEGEKGQKVSVVRPIAVANVRLICPSCGKPSRVGYRAEGDRKFRICKACSATIR